MYKYGGKTYVGDGYFGNKERQLPTGASYYEYDVHPYTGGNRGAERIVYGSDGKFYYTADHYKNFILVKF